MAKVTFKQNIDHYVVGDVRDLDKDELKRLEEYAKRWDIKGDYLVKGEQAITNEEAPRTEKKTLGGDTVESSQDNKAGEGQTAGNTRRRASKPATTSTTEGGDGNDDSDEGKTPAEELPVDTDDVVKDGDNDPEPSDPDANHVEESDEGDGNGSPSTQTPKPSEQTAQTQGQGSTPAQASKPKGSAKK